MELAKFGNSKKSSIRGRLSLEKLKSRSTKPKEKKEHMLATLLVGIAHTLIWPALSWRKINKRRMSIEVMAMS